MHFSALRQARQKLSVRSLDMVADTRRTSRSEEGFEAVVKNLAQFCGSNVHSTPVSQRHAAVLVPLFEQQSGDVRVLLTKRSSKLKSHPGEICFPGGKRELDEDDVATALREAQEEIGLDPKDVTIVGKLPPCLSKHLLSVTPVIATIPRDLTFTPDPSEVEDVLSISLSRFLKAGPGYKHKDVEWEPGISYRLHFFEHTYNSTKYIVWGWTAGISIFLAETGCGRAAEFEVNPPSCKLPYTALAFERGKIVYRNAEKQTMTALPGGGILDEEAEAAVHCAQ